MTSPAVIDNFRGRYAYLSNFHPAPHHWEQITYPTTEHSFNAGKTLDMAQRLWIAAAPTPNEAKRRGRSVKLRPGWDGRARFEVMAEVLAAKFNAHPGMAAALVSTGDALLVEGNVWHDNVWGDCRCGRAACVEVGANHLGRMLMRLRSDLLAPAVSRG